MLLSRSRSIRERRDHLVFLSAQPYSTAGTAATAFQGNHSILCSHTCNIMQWHVNSQNESNRTQWIEAVWEVSIWGTAESWCPNTHFGSKPPTEICFRVHLLGTWLEDMPNDLCSTCLSGHEVMESSLHHMYTTMVGSVGLERHWLAVPPTLRHQHLRKCCYCKPRWMTVWGWQNFQKCCRYLPDAASMSKWRCSWGAIVSLKLLILPLQNHVQLQAATSKSVGPGKLLNTTNCTSARANPTQVMWASGQKDAKGTFWKFRCDRTYDFWL